MACRPTTMPPGLSGIPYGVDAVDQFQVVTSGGQAELGRALGGYINVLTKSGTNAARGEIYDFSRDDRFNAPNALRSPATIKLPMRPEAVRRQPWRPDRARPHLLLLELRAAAAGSVRAGDDLAADVAAINARLAAVGYPGSPIATGVYPNPVHTTNFLGKVDHQFSGNGSVQRPLQPVRRQLEQLARRGRAERAHRVVRARQHRSVARVRRIR